MRIVVLRKNEKLPAHANGVKRDGWRKALRAD
jgi:hypothetical protein